MAKAYYWHRFFSHQPDLNFDSPLVRRTVIRTLDYWAQMGVDGFRLDAIPYLYEREGTSSENLPETHAFLKELRRHMDATNPGRMLLSEANMWPEDAVAYFGKGDECHMNFHFPLMPRLFMALRLEDRMPIVEILKRTPAIPETCQWAMFLRNHDELTLEMVTDEERDYMYRVYASDQRARINLGIRRRLAPLLGNDRPRIEVMNALLFSMPGTPVIYYGDEIGMGDNVYLGDRNGVRTPMQWSPDRNAGFSATNPQRLYLPVNIDPAYHYEAVNVESQQDNPASLLNWTKRLIALRKQYKAFGRGTLEFLTPSNQRVLVFYRRYGDETILVVANLSRFSQAVELDLQQYKGYTPVEMFGRTEFPVVGEGYYVLTLGPNSFFWFVMEHRATPVALSAPTVQRQEAQLPVILIPALVSLWEANSRANIANAMPAFLSSRRWFRARGRRFRSVTIREVIPIVQGTYVLTIVRVEYTTGDPEDYVVPIATARGDEATALKEDSPESLLAEVQIPDGTRALLYSATRAPEFANELLQAFARRRRFSGERGHLVAQRNREFRHIWGGSHPNLQPQVLPLSEVNTSLKFGDRFVMKLLRSVEPGINPGMEMGQLLTEKQPQPSPLAAPLAGSLEYQTSSGENITVAVLHGFVPNEGSAWQQTRKHLVGFIEMALNSKHSKSDIQKSSPTNFYTLSFALAPPPEIATELIGSYLPLAETMGKRVAELHQIFARDSSDPAFAPEPFNDFYRQGIYHGYMGLTGRRMEFIRQRASYMTDDVRVLAEKVLEQENAIITKLGAVFHGRIPSQRTRFHGRLHLGHMLVKEGDVVLFDFEGDPDQHLSERRIKRCPVRDVTSMLLSLGYAAQSAVRQMAWSEGSEIPPIRTLRVWLRFWYSHVSAAFLRGYWSVAQNASYLPRTQEQQEILLQTYLLERALLDVRADIEDKPELSGMPLRIILHLLDAEAEQRIGE